MQLFKSLGLLLCACVGVYVLTTLVLVFTYPLCSVVIDFSFFSLSLSSSSSTGDLAVKFAKFTLHKIYSALQLLWLVYSFCSILILFLFSFFLFPLRNLLLFFLPTIFFTWFSLDVSVCEIRPTGRFIPLHTLCVCLCLCPMFHFTSSIVPFRA